MKLKKLLSVAMVVFMIAALIGCSKTNNANTKTGTEPGSVKESGQSSTVNNDNNNKEENKEKVDEPEPKKLDNPNIYLFGNENDKNWADAKKAYEELYGEGTVTMENIPFNELEAKFMTLSAVGEAPAIYGGNFPQDAIKGLLRPLDDLIDLRDPAWNLKLMESQKWNGKYYRATSESWPQIIFYNKTMFENYGEKTPYEYFKDGEWTWAKLAEVAKKFTEDTDGDGNIDVYGFGLANYMLPVVIASNASNLYIYTETSIESAMKDQKTLEALNFIQQGSREKWFIEKDPDKLFLEGKLAMTIGQPPFHITAKLAEFTQEWGVAPVPNGPGNLDGLNPVKVYPRGIPTHTKNPEGGAEFLRLLCIAETKNSNDFSMWNEKDPDYGEVVSYAKANPFVVMDVIGGFKQKQWPLWGDVRGDIPIATVIEKHEPILIAELEAVLQDNKVDLDSYKEQKEQK